MSKLSLKVIALVAVLALGAVACSSVNVGELVEEGKLTICTDAPYAPFEFEDTSKPSGYSGFDMDLMQEIADEVGDLELSVKVVPFDGIWLLPAAGECDVVASAMTITDDRAQNALFTDPYFDADQSLLVRSADSALKLADMSGKRIAVQTGTTGEIYANDNNPGADIVSFDEPAAMFLGLESGDVDAILQDLPVNGERAAQEPDKFVVSDTFPTGEQYGFSVAPGNTDLQSAINDALTTLRDNGTYGDIHESYFGTRG
ncbi:MAG: basic amino acid ABC transporter substrate-binding protein [Acidimicrobiia bacterium]|nr:basic amino acid ABC transporter substrate-binding protein [Acidimicrobiia bacterium]NNF70344.1 basic amino acid ABC transporter substrate-binding protein [Acidimicrobiia bacterium]NNK92162.1 basic amino acid ABC transporter substrate-binding protein [Acidimicrobiia bacterium]